MPKILPILLQLFRTRPCVCILSHLLPVMTEGSFVLPQILTISLDVVIVVLKVAAISSQVLPILLQIPPILFHVLTILTCISLWGVSLGKDRTATQHRYRYTHL